MIYSLERRVKKEHWLCKVSYLIADTNYKTVQPTKKAKVVPKPKEVLFVNLSTLSSKLIKLEEVGIIP